MTKKWSIKWCTISYKKLVNGLKSKTFSEECGTVKINEGTKLNKKKVKWLKSKTLSEGLYRIQIKFTDLNVRH